MIEQSEKCVECRACEEICPTSSIHFTNYGDISINPKTCIKCNLCEKVCQITSPLSYNKQNKIYAAISRDQEKVIGSSSGGMAYLLYQKVLDMGGVVFGVKYSDKNIPVYDFAETKEELSCFSKSKYVFSNVANSYKECKQFCDTGRKVLFVGLPCQIAGLRLYLKKEYDNLITADVLCHGAPHYSIFSNHIKYLEKKRNKEVLEYQFRDKTNSDYGPYSFSIKYDDGNVETGSALWDAYYNAFLKASILRDACYSCKFACRERVSDITLGDFWNAKETIPELNGTIYVSSLIISSNKGRLLIESCQDRIQLFETNYEDLCRSTHAVVKPPANDNKIDVSLLRDFGEYCKWARKYENSLPVLLRKLKNKVKW